MGQTVLTWLAFKPPGPPPHEKLYGCGLYFALFLPGKQWCRLLSLLQEKPACVSCALGGHSRAFITELRQTSAGLWSHDKLIIHCELPEKAIKLWERVREPLLANTGLGHCVPCAQPEPPGHCQGHFHQLGQPHQQPGLLQHLNLQPCFAPALCEAGLGNQGTVGTTRLIVSETRRSQGLGDDEDGQQSQGCLVGTAGSKEMNIS